MAREPELSIKVKVDPQINPTELQTDINQKIPKDGVEIKGKLNVPELLRGISEYQKDGQNLALVRAKISNVKEAIKIFENEQVNIFVDMKASPSSISTIKTQLQNMIDTLDFSKVQIQQPGKKGANPNGGNNPSTDVDVVLNVTPQALADLKTKIETGLGTIDVTPDVTAAHLTALRQKIETELNKIKFTPQPQVKNPSPSPGGGGGGRASSKSDLTRNLVEQSQILNKQDTAANNKHYRNVNVQRNRKMDLEIQEAADRAELAKVNPNYQNEDWYRKAELKAQYVRDDYTSAQADKADLDIVKKLNEAFKENITLREKLSRISKPQSPQDWNNVNFELRKSNHTVAKTGQQAVKQGVYLGNIKQNYSNQVKAIAEKARNKLFEEFEDELKQYISSGYRHVNAIGDKNYEKATRLWSEQNSHKTNLDNITKEMHARGYDKYDPQDNSGTYQKYIKLAQNRVKAENELAIAIKDRTDAQKDATVVDNSDISRLAKITAQLERQKHTLDGSDEGKASNVYSVVTKNTSLSKKLTTDLDTHQGINKDLITRSWANKNGISGINSLADAYDYLRKEVDLASIEVEKFSDENVKLNKQLQNQVRVSNLQSQLHDYLEKFPKVEKKLNEQVSKLQNGLASPDAANNVKELSKQMAALRSRAKELGLETENLLDKFEKLFGQHLSTMIVMAALHKMQDAARQVYQNVVDIDTAMTELRKVTNETDSTYVKFMEDAADRAQRVGATISDTITATADFARLGYNLENASSISDAALIYKNVGDGISDINTASESLISTMQAFNIQAKDSMKIVDEFNEAGNNFAISSAGVGEALQRSGAALAAANNTMEQSIALATTMNRIIQNPEAVGTTLKTVSMYLRSTKADVEAAGESTEGMAETTSKLRDSLKALSHGQVDIFDSATKQYKSTTDIIIEMGKAWDKMSDKEQAAALELMGGKRNANAVSALITNYQEIEKVIETVSNANGSAKAENAKYLDSIQGRLTELDSTFQAFSTHVLDSDVPKFFISIATAIVKAADAMVKFTGAFPMGAGIGAFVTQLGKPKMTGFMIVPSNTPGGDTEQVLCRYILLYLCEA